MPRKSIVVFSQVQCTLTTMDGSENGTPRDKELFLSHTWAPDEEGRNTHERALRLARHLESMGWTVWIDSNDLKGDIDASMAAGIYAARAVIICLTRQYMRKINYAAGETCLSNDNCFKEFTYTCTRKKVVIPVLFEGSVNSNPGNWSPGVVQMRIGTRLYVDGTDDDMQQTAQEISRALYAHGVHRRVLASRRRRLSRITPIIRV